VNEAVFHPSARAELDESALFYESRLRGLGTRFAASVEEAVERIAGSPAATIHLCVRRRAALRRARERPLAQLMCPIAAARDGRSDAE
jgi:hypothetical protein